MTRTEDVLLQTLETAIADVRAAQPQHEACCPLCVFGGEFTIGVLEALVRSARKALKNGVPLGPIEGQAAFMLGRILGLVVKGSVADYDAREQLAMRLVELLANQMTSLAGLQLTASAELSEDDDVSLPPGTTQH